MFGLCFTMMTPFLPGPTSRSLSFNNMRAGGDADFSIEREMRRENALIGNGLLCPSYENRGSALCMVMK
jgi:hypothetical protein